MEEGGDIMRENTGEHQYFLGGNEVLEWVVLRDDDIFDLEPIIEAISRAQKGKKRMIYEVEIDPKEFKAECRRIH